jgi:hypothetical protein
MIDSCAMPSNKKKASHSEQYYAVGDHVSSVDEEGGAG